MVRDNKVVDKKCDPKHYKNHFDKLDYEGIPMPISLDDVKKFERRNKLAINIYGLNKELV